MSLILQNTTISAIHQSTFETKKKPIITMSTEEQRDIVLTIQRLRDLDARVQRAKNALSTFNYKPPVQSKVLKWWERLFPRHA